MSYATPDTQKVFSNLVALMDGILQDRDFFKQDLHVRKAIDAEPNSAPEHRFHFLSCLQKGLSVFNEAHEKGYVFVNKPTARKFQDCWEKPTDAQQAQLKDDLSSPQRAQHWAYGQAFRYLGKVTDLADTFRDQPEGVKLILQRLAPLFDEAAKGRPAGEILEDYQHKCAIESYQTWGEQMSVSPRVSALALRA